MKFPCNPNANDDAAAMINYLRDAGCHPPGCVICDHLHKVGAVGVYLGQVNYELPPEKRHQCICRSKHLGVDNFKFG